MLRTKNENVVENFFNGVECCNHGESLTCRNGKLINYSTTIAQWTQYGLTINDTKYSATTSKIQNMLKRMSNNRKEVHIVSNVNKGCYDLTEYVKEFIVE